jgi:hypothetical protein
MKEITNYVAFNGVMFENKEKCLTYENDAINNLFEEYFKTIDYLETDEFELFNGFGSEDNLIDIVDVKSTKDLLIIFGISLYFLDEVGYKDDVKEKKTEEIKALLEKVLNDDEDRLIVYRGKYERQYFFIASTTKKLTSDILNFHNKKN